ncbi:unnamed protein product [Ilex paraguariensis]
MATEDFSFPTITDTPPRFIESPPLWRSPSLASHQVETRREASRADDHGENTFPVPKQISYSQRKSFSCIERGARIESSDDEDDKMDMLWEDFNEEFSRSCESGLESDISPGRMVELSCVQALKLSKNGGHALARKRPPSLVVFMKVLKKFFLVHNSHRPINKRSR